MKEKLDKFQKQIATDHPSSRIEIVDGRLWVAVGQGEQIRIIKLPLEALDHPNPTELLKGKRP